MEMRGGRRPRRREPGESSEGGDRDGVFGMRFDDAPEGEGFQGERLQDDPGFAEMLYSYAVDKGARCRIPVERGRGGVGPGRARGGGGGGGGGEVGTPADARRRASRCAPSLLLTRAGRASAQRA